MTYQARKMTIAIIHFLIPFHHGTSKYLLFDIDWSMRWQMTYQAKKMTIATIHMLLYSIMIQLIICYMLLLLHGMADDISGKENDHCNNPYDHSIPS
jgi:hypothetical protein